MYNKVVPFRSLQLDEAHFQLVMERARILGITAEEFVSRLIDGEDALSDVSFDDLLDPVRKGFEHLSDDELDAIFAAARKRAAGQERQ